MTPCHCSYLGSGLGHLPCHKHRGSMTLGALHCSPEGLCQARQLPALRTFQCCRETSQRHQPCATGVPAEDCDPPGRNPPRSGAEEGSKEEAAESQGHRKSPCSRGGRRQSYWWEESEASEFIPGCNDVTDSYTTASLGAVVTVLPCLAFHSRHPLAHCGRLPPPTKCLSPAVGRCLRAGLS